MPANNFGISYKHEDEENYSNHWPRFITSGQKCGINSNAEYQAFKRPKMMNSKMGLEDNRSNVAMTVGPQPPCLQFKRWGSCSYGDECRYAHITGPLKGIRVEDQRNLSKVKSCHFFGSGKECPYGNKCHFLHERNQKPEGGVGFCRISSAISIATIGREVRNNTSSDAVDLRIKLLKTRFCINWERTGTCAYGSKCQFAHGKAVDELLLDANYKDGHVLRVYVQTCHGHSCLSSKTADSWIFQYTGVVGKRWHLCSSQKCSIRV
ncbi:zinc finger CCCH domain-containing protein 39-like isoform X2 [Nicotiana tabacum]|uniref:Uncharacterized protein isoform X2 n=1 Tax=Nicotiana tabacum TaxID=4097 RepID=A0A1S3Z3N6_TOBAC|nr:zinc finger CCCH domain-containing protein 42-like isoform X2 [Nicotiana tomentosiformis]XP_016459039.1 PREDICTED: uncharacterized protein LOC107782654 isoform X2 [Nicotiana tabacum]